MGVIILAGDFNSRVGESKDYVEYDILANNLLNNMPAFLSYDKDYTCSRRSEDKHVNNFGRKLLELCRASGLRICNGRVSEDTQGKYTFFNHLGSSVIDYVLVGKDDFDAIESVTVKDFNEWSDHAPVEVCIHNVKNYQRYDNHNIFCSNVTAGSVYRWNEEAFESIKSILHIRANERY